MVKRYSNQTPKPEHSTVVNASAAVIQQILNYSKSLEVKKMKHSKVLVHLN